MKHQHKFWLLINEHKFNHHRVLNIKELLQHPVAYARFAVGDIIVNMRDEIAEYFYDPGHDRQTQGAAELF